jgi:hypothetical protein
MDGLGYHEHTDGFNRNNIPETLLNLAYHILPGSVQGGPVSHTHQDTNTEVNIGVFFRGYRNSSEAIDAALLAMDTIIKDCCKIANRTNTGAGIFNVVFEGAELSPLSSDENENTVIVEMLFTVNVKMGIEE